MIHAASASDLAGMGTSDRVAGTDAPKTINEEEHV